MSAEGQRPLVAVLAVVIRAGQVLLVRRANPPDAGFWGFPGGKVEFAEPLLAAAARELFEETGIRAEPQAVLTALDALDRGPDGQVLGHFVLVAVRCLWQSGAPVAADDALEARWVALDELEALAPQSADVTRVARLAAG
ncbi:ADP-ribose pyrophosphatase [Rhodovulum sulfidophilum]|uniref:NUDIX hydrolase n=1 Tax=Rhodovulum visakhapatnamense TaxID=364297 RepID=A0ABS1RH79_9RHOB|nr:NUDIX hydrolase [Rhodovulum visakhapatnamense]MBL3567965.1 NUDIX hydrolase [Rhodovulum visakhapatnamense]MBL3579006.1 NUDIX hydrolase [Rhodovulum visakhapatnamense]OLS46302.1 ADP-ribose pyrophosphatase [Rhodovulum sulfidophilum]